jgi:uroporphyrinogen decarboxylase
MVPRKSKEEKKLFRKKEMNSRERLLRALNHREPDRVPIDLGGTPTSTISIGALENLKSYLGLKNSTRSMSNIFLTAYPDEEIIQGFGIDVKMITANPPASFKLQVSTEGKIIDEWELSTKSTKRPKLTSWWKTKLPFIVPHLSKK